MHACTQKYTRTQAHMLLHICVVCVNTHTHTHTHTRTHTSRYGEHARQQTATQAHLVCIDAIIFNKSSPRTYLFLTLTLQSSHWCLNPYPLARVQVVMYTFACFHAMAFLHTHACVYLQKNAYAYGHLWVCAHLWYTSCMIYQFSIYSCRYMCDCISTHLNMCIYTYIHIHVVIFMYISVDVHVDV